MADGIVETQSELELELESESELESEPMVVELESESELESDSIQDTSSIDKITSVGGGSRLSIASEPMVNLVYVGLSKVC